MGGDEGEGEKDDIIASPNLSHFVPAIANRPRGEELIC